MALQFYPAMDRPKLIANCVFSLLTTLQEQIDVKEVLVAEIEWANTLAAAR